MTNELIQMKVYGPHRVQTRDPSNSRYNSLSLIVQLLVPREVTGISNHVAQMTLHCLMHSTMGLVSPGVYDSHRLIQASQKEPKSRYILESVPHDFYSSLVEANNNMYNGVLILIGT